MFARVRTREFYWIYSHQIKHLSGHKSKKNASIQKHKQAATNGKVSKIGDNSEDIPAIPQDVQTQHRIENKGPMNKTIRRINEHQIIRPDFSEECFDETSYYFENGLRKVYPYQHTLTSHARDCWIGGTLLDICAREFRMHSPDVYTKLILNGLVTVNNKRVQPDYKIKKYDLLRNLIHKHEKPVLDQSIEIIHVDDDMVVVNKPPSLPVFPSGRYRHNTVRFVLAREFDLKELYRIHRLDRLTSGILLFGRSLKRQQKIGREIRERLVEKQYVCRVEGEFPNGSIKCDEAIDGDNSKNEVCFVSATGKESCTMFEKLSSSGRTSVVLCKPKTGRKHQIRVHLQYLGFPIINDPLYNNNYKTSIPWKRHGGDFDGKADNRLGEDLLADTHTAKYQLVGEAKCGNRNQSVAKEPLYGKFDNKFDPRKMTIDENCSDCTKTYPDPEPKDLVLYLHSLKYAGPDWSYETSMPKWANEDWTDDL